MIHSVYFEYKVFLIFLLLGIIIGAVFGLINFIKLIFKNNKILTQVLEFVFAVLLGLLFFIGTNFYNFGVFRLYLLFSYLLGLLIERKTIGKIFAKFYVLVYTKTIKLINNFKKSKVGVVILK